MTPDARPRLDWRRLDALAPGIARPTYRPDAVRIGIVHLGVGNFHRAHQAPCFDDALNAGDLRWGVCGANLQRPVLREALLPQQGLYTLVVDPGGPGGPCGPAASADGSGQPALRVIGCLRELLTAADDGAALIARMADPAVHWWTLTITEKGYGRAADGTLDMREPALQADLAATALPRTAPGLLYAALLRRFGGGEATGAPTRRLARQAAAARALTIASCDNLSANGRTLRGLLLAFAEQARREPRWRAFGGKLQGAAGPVDATDCLPELIATSIAVPDSMIDRIVPATTDALRAGVADALGCVDAWPVPAEPFSQWVIADVVTGARPPLARSGVEWVADVAPYEALKLRMLNAAHSAMAYAGLLCGHATVDQAIADPAIRAWIGRLWSCSVVPTLPPAAAQRAPAYADALLARFANPATAHALRQIGMDGSLKLPLRWLPTWRAARTLGLPAVEIVQAFACWIRWLQTVVPEALADPKAAQLTAAARRTDAAAAVLDCLGLDPAEREPLAGAIVPPLARLAHEGVAPVLLASAGPA